jgi:Zn-dependent protease
LHASFLFFAILILWLAARDPAAVGLGYGCLAVAILFVSVLAHEIGHAAAALRAGFGGEPLSLTPVGGLPPQHPAHEPQQELVTALAGPAVNLVVWMFFMAPVAIAGGSPLGLLNPLRPTDLFDGPMWAVGIKLTYWINWLLFLVNMAPASPLDGVRIYRALLWPAFDYRNSVAIVARGAQFLAIAVCLVGWLGHDFLDSAAMPAWVPLSMAGLFLFFGGRQDLARLDDPDIDDDLFSYDFSQGYTSLERRADRPRRRVGRLRGWLERRRRERRRRQMELERDEERQVDEILGRLHETGIDALDPKERALLERVSARLRNRQQAE